MPGITRRRFGRGFAYVDAVGRRVSDPDVLTRIRSLAIPPAWVNVWICDDAAGHLQAVGFDARGRRQYRYHEQWRRRRDLEKFDKMMGFARTLPDLREFVADRLQGTEMDRDRALACAVRLLDLGFFRIGGEEYAETNQTYGLATIERRHVRLKADTVIFDYVAKGGRRRIEAVVDPEVAEVVAQLKRRRSGGPRLLAYRSTARSHWREVRSADINAWISEVTGGQFTAKDFRTWSATVLAALALAVSREAASDRARARAVVRAMQETAHYLGNTPAVCRRSYVDPRLVEHFLSGTVIDLPFERLGEGIVFGQPSTQGLVENAVLDLLTEDQIRLAA